jgi:hypothetical protein
MTFVSRADAMAQAAQERADWGDRITVALIGVAPPESA